MADRRADGERTGIGLAISMLGVLGGAFVGFWVAGVFVGDDCRDGESLSCWINGGRVVAICLGAVVGLIVGSLIARSVGRRGRAAPGT